VRYQIVRFFFDERRREVLDRHLSLREAQEHCLDCESSSATCKSHDGKKITAQHGSWVDLYHEEIHGTA